MARVLAPIRQTGCNFLPSTSGFWQGPNPESVWTDEQAMAAYWRVKKWNVTGSVSGLASGSCSCEIVVNASEESDLVCYTQSISSEESVSGDITFIGADIQPDGIVIVLGVEYSKYDPDEGENVQVSGGFTWFPATDGSNQAIVTLGDISRKMFSLFSPSFSPGESSDVSATVSMTAVEWWSYDGLYSTSTGQRI